MDTFTDEALAALFTLAVLMGMFLVGAGLYCFYTLVTEMTRKFRDDVIRPKPRRGETLWEAYERSERERPYRNW